MKQFNAFVIGLFIFVNQLHLNAQPAYELVPDRPAQSATSLITPPQHLQIESGLYFEHFNDDFQYYLAPSVLWKYGVNETFEFRMTTDIISSIEKNGNNTTGLLPMSFGIKTKLINERGWLPSTAFVGQLTTRKLGSKDFHSDNVVPSFRFAMDHTLSGKFGLSYNLGAAWYDASGSNTTYIYTLALGYGISSRLAGFTEIFGFLAKELEADHRIDAGLSYLLGKAFMVDLAGGFGLSSPYPKYFVTLGVSYRANLLK